LPIVEYRKGEGVCLEVKVDKSEFSLAKTKLAAAAEKLRQCHSEQQNLLHNLTSGWKGKGGDSFRDCAREISAQTLMGIFMITSLNSKAATAQSDHEAIDKSLAKAISR
jgi:uncharacterized protein YukE